MAKGFLWNIAAITLNFPPALGAAASGVENMFAD
jgi:hypothetical protein